MSEDKPEIIPEETLANPPATETETPETTETAEAETPEAETEETETTEDRPKRESGYSRMKRRALIAEAQLANARLKEVGTETKDDKAPKEEDFNGDWGKYIAATAAYEAARAVRGSLAEDRKVSQQTHAERLNQEVLADFNERADAFKSKAKDFDDVVEGFVAKGGKFSDAVRELVMESDVGPQLTYHLAKNPVLANKISSLAPLQAAKEIARLEDTLSNTSVKPTRAPAPLTPVKGGAKGTFNPATASMDEYVAKWNAGWRG